MPTYSENGKNSYTAAAAVVKGNILKFTSNDAQGLPSVTPTTDATDVPIAIALTDANAGEKVAVKILGTGGTTLVKAGSAVPAGELLSSLGTVSPAVDTPVIGRALGTATAAGELIEVATVPGLIHYTQGS